MTDIYDLIAIGAGPAGESATELASFFGHRSAVIEKARPGGTVTTTGGAPTKTLREAALYVSGFCEGETYGFRMATPPEIATDIVRKRTWSVCDLLQRVTADNIAKSNVDYIQGAARLDSDSTVVVSGEDGKDRELRAKAVLIATGSRPFRPKHISFDIPGVCDTDTILQRGRVPKGIIIVGGGPVGVEFATICHVLGAKVPSGPQSHAARRDCRTRWTPEADFSESGPEARRRALHRGYCVRDRGYRANGYSLWWHDEHDR